MTPIEMVGPLIGCWYQTWEEPDLDDSVTHYLPPRVIVMDIRIDMFPPLQPVVHQHRS